ncbi:type I DNA topoisomerase [Candidatus Falkowbacteria bacterium]|nr:type I DNA topoisomerase [Candidatus Falkowbacteria bacterium]
MMSQLVIVESPTKAKTISKFLSKDFKVESSFGHVRDLPERTIGIDIENNFEPQYVITPKAKKRVDLLRKLAKQADNVLFASDEDREGEAIAWHLLEILKPKKYQRIAFHEITKHAIDEALKNPRDIDLNLVDSQQARRVLDRLVGYKLSPFLWRKVAKKLSAGRVQSVAVRLVVEREREIQNFKQDEYWTIEGVFKKDADEFPAKLHAVNNKLLKKLEITNKEAADKLVEAIKTKQYFVKQIEQSEKIKQPLPPLVTSTLQQAANNVFGFSAKQTMQLAQMLYEGVEIPGEGSVGLITYMRTDSVNLSSQFLDGAREHIQNNFGTQYLPTKARAFKTKSKNAQEAHEAIRPTHVERTPASLATALERNQLKLYTLIWARAIASQMSAAKFANKSIQINDPADEFSFKATGSTLVFDGYIKVLLHCKLRQEKTDDIVLLPNLVEKDKVDLQKLNPEQHFTQPPARYTEATLIKALEEFGIGRPSTYAPTLATIQVRGYVEKEEKKLKPTPIAFTVTDVLTEHFSNIVDYKFTADMEDDLDKIAIGQKKWQPMIKNFYEPFIANLKKKDSELSKKDITEEKTDKVCEKCGSLMIIKIGRYGKFFACSNYPTCKNTLHIEEIQRASANNSEAVNGLLEEKCPDCGSPLVNKHGKYGAFIGCSNYPKCKYIKKENNDTGIICPECGVGKVVRRRGKHKFFYGCSEYPKCNFVSWEKPVETKIEN